MTHRNADTRIREAFDALRAELADVLGEPPPPTSATLSARHLHSSCLVWLEEAEAAAHDFAKLPADA